MGYSGKTRSCLNQEFPKQISKGLEDMDKGAEKDAFKTAGCGKNMNVAVTLQGRAYTWGKGDFMKFKFNEVKQYSRPFPICSNIQISSVNVGFDHCMLVDWKGHLWSYGENSKGNLGTGDTKKKLSPLSVPFFSNKRVIDVACGDQFSVVIAEVYNIDKDEEAAYFEQKDLSNLQAFFSNDLYENIDNSNGKKPKLISTKMHV